MVDLKHSDQLVLLIKETLRRFEMGAPPPVGARELLQELSDGLAAGGPSEGGLSLAHWRAAREIATEGVAGLKDDRPEVQGRQAEKALRGLCKIFEGQTPGAADHERAAGVASGHPESRLPRGSRAAVLVVLVAGLSIAIFRDKLRIGDILLLGFVLLLGASLIANGLALGPRMHARKPRILEEGYLGRSVAHYVPVRVGGGWWVIWGLVFWGFVGYVLWVSVPEALVIPRQGQFVGYAPHGPPRFRISFTVAGSAIRDSVVAWQASCHSGKELDDQVSSSYAPISGWTGSEDYVTGGPNGITEHVHVIEDTGTFTRPTRAAGAFSLSLVLYQNGRKIDTCKTGTVRWSATPR